VHCLSRQARKDSQARKEGVEQVSRTALIFQTSKENHNEQAKTFFVPRHHASRFCVPKKGDAFGATI
jgi:hypothetical protein